jgi:transposase-like protein
MLVMTARKTTKQDPRTRRYAPDVRERALQMLGSGIGPKVVADKLGPTTETLRLWRKQEQVATESEPPEGVSVAERPMLSPGGLSEVEVGAVLQMKRKHPSYGPEQVQAQLRRFKGWRVSRKAVARVFKDNGYELVHVASRPQGDEHPHRWEAPRRNAIWQMDLTDLMVGADIPRPRGEGRFDLDHTLPGIQQMADTTEIDIAGNRLKIVAVQDPGTRASSTATSTPTR